MKEMVMATHRTLTSVLLLFCFISSNASPAGQKRRAEVRGLENANIQCPVISKGNEECYIAHGDCIAPEDVFRICLNPIERGLSAYHGLRSVETLDEDKSQDDSSDDDSLETSENDSPERESSEEKARSTRGLCTVYVHKGNQCYYQPFGSACKRPTSIFSRCAQRYNFKRDIDATKHRRDDQFQVRSPESKPFARRNDHVSVRSPESKPFARRNDHVSVRSPESKPFARRNDHVSVRSHESIGDSKTLGDGGSTLRKLLSFDNTEREDGKQFEDFESERDGQLMDRQKRSIYYYDSYDVDYVPECMVYKLAGFNCYWRPVGNNCKKPKLVYAKCTQLPDFDSYDRVTK